MLSLAKLFPNQSTTTDSSNGILDISKWKIDEKKTKIQEIYDNFKILQENLDLPEYQKFIFDNFGELIDTYSRCSDYLGRYEPSLIYNNKMIEYDLININQFMEYIKKINMKMKYNIRIGGVIIKIIEYIKNNDDDKFVMLWNKYKSLIFSNNLFICDCYSDSKIQNMLPDEVLVDIFTNFTVEKFMKSLQSLESFSKEEIIKNYLNICKKLNLHQDTIYNYTRTTLYESHYMYMDFVKCCYEADKDKFKTVFFDMAFVHYMAVNKNKPSFGEKNLLTYVDKILDSGDYNEFLRTYMPHLISYKIIDDIAKKQIEIERKLDLIMQKLNIYDGSNNDN
jgi:hypothetical protein